MLEPVKMVYINLLSLGVVILTLFLYQYFFPKKNFPYFLALILASLLPIVSIFRHGTYESGDLSLHSKFALDFFQNLTEGNLIPQWAKHMCVSYGCPNFLYMYPFPYYVISFIHLLGLSFISSIKTYLIITYVLSGIFMYLWIKKELNSRAAFVASIFYLYAPYHLVDLHFRVTIAEMASFMILPLIFLSIKYLNLLQRKRWFAMLSISISFLILSHQAIIVTALPLFVIFAFILNRWKLNRKVLLTLISIAIGFLFTSFYWLPILVEKYFILFGNNSYVFFPKIQEFIYSPWRYGLLFQGPIGQLSFVIGYIQIVIFLLSIFFFKRIGFQKHRSLYILFLLTFIFIFLMMQSFSEPLWNVVPLIKGFQFSYRLLVIVAFSVSVIAGITISKIKSNRIMLFLVLFTILTTILNWGNRRVIPDIGDEYLRQEFYKGDPGHGDLTTPVWVDIKNTNKYPLKKDKLEIISGNAQIRPLNDKTTYHSYIVNVNKPTLLQENTFYYPKWTITANKTEVPLYLKTKNKEGLLVFKLPRGLYLVEVEFKNTFIRSFTLVLSGVSFFIFCIVLLIFRNKKIS